MKRLTPLLAPFLLLGCDSGSEWMPQSIDEASISGRLPTVGSMEEEVALSEVYADATWIDFRVDAFPDGQWAMLGGYLQTDGPLEPGQVFDVPPWQLIGCSGPAAGTFDFDASPSEATVTVVGAEGAGGDDGALALVVDASFGGDSHVVAVVPLDE